MKDIILKVENISLSVDKKPCLPAGSNSFSGYQSVEILKNISFEVERGKVLGISGQSGSGKSTIAKILAGVISQTSGKIEKSFKKDWSNASPNPVQILFQNDGELINPFRKVKDVLNEAFELKLGINKDYSVEINYIFSRFNLNPQLKERKGSQLSGGEKQRIALARIIIVKPEILVLDEPFSSQDVESQLSILNLINKLKEEFNLTIICISHDLNILKHFSDSLLIMYKGKIVESGTTKGLLENQDNEYTRFLLSAQSLNLTETEIQTFHKNMSKTNAIRILESNKIKFESIIYEVDENDLSGETVALKVGAEPDTVFKTLVCVGDKTGHIVFCIPVTEELNLKKAAVASGNKKVEMIKLKGLLPLTGYIRGGCSPIGMKKLFPTFIDETAQLFDRICVSAGVRGTQIKLNPDDLLKIISGSYSELI